MTHRGDFTSRSRDLQHDRASDRGLVAVIVTSLTNYRSLPFVISKQTSWRSPGWSFSFGHLVEVDRHPPTQPPLSGNPKITPDL